MPVSPTTDRTPIAAMTEETITMAPDSHMRSAEFLMDEAHHLRQFPAAGHARAHPDGCVHAAQGRADDRDNHCNRHGDHQAESDAGEQIVAYKHSPDRRWALKKRRRRPFR